MNAKHHPPPYLGQQPRGRLYTEKFLDPGKARNAGDNKCGETRSTISVCAVAVSGCTHHKLVGVVQANEVLPTEQHDSVTKAVTST